MELDGAAPVTIENDKEMEEWLFNGSGMKVGLCIYNKPKSVRVIAENTALPLLKVKLVINKFMSLGLVECTEKYEANGITEKYYKLIQSNLEFVYDRKLVDMATMRMFLSDEMNKVMNSISSGVGVGHAKHISIKANEKDVERFLKDVDTLIENYNAVEDPEASDIYTLISVIGKSGE